MKVGVLSDSHDNVRNMEKAVEIMKKENVEFVIHLGDAVSPFALIPLKELKAEKIYIFGNNDGEIYMHMKVGEKCGLKVLDPPVEAEVGGKKLLLLHGYHDEEFTRKLVDSLAQSGNWDAVLYGHTHKFDNRVLGKTTILNPGNLTGVYGEASMAIWDMEKNKINKIELK